MKPLAGNEIKAPGQTAVKLAGLPAANGHGFKHRCKRTITRYPVLDLFAGICGISVALSAVGIPAESYEVYRSELENVFCKLLSLSHPVSHS